ncbi:ankyrin-3-like isoform X1 [Diorhabda sublineata]|uniref:ankyrin-3-like isoform X1 n=1 Tax=Diorhabda sublineata TaxID=1163346 RepID=UPI0024E15FCE|nr:ankyrin-3-like isoform X1 [Diorhabda sublineata]
MNSNDSDEEMFPFNPEYSTPFAYNDPVLVEGVLGAVLESDLGKLISLVDSGKSLNINDNNGNTALHYAACKNNLEILNYLVVQDDIRINTRNFLGQTPLYLAVKSGFIEATTILINHKANVNLPDNEDISPLHRSVTKPDIAHLLIKNGANINVRDYSDDTPLHDAVGDKCLETICMLLYYNADSNAVGGNGLTPFMKALISENEEVQAALFDYVDDFNATSLDEYSTLTLALTNDNPYVEQIIARGAEVDSAAFTACVRVPNVDNFKLVWRNLKPEHIEDSNVSLSILYYGLDPEDFGQYIDVIIENSSGAVLEVLAAKTKSIDYASIIDKCTQDAFLTHNQVTKLTCLLLQHGFVMCTDLIVVVFANMGFCELFKILMYMDYVDDWSPFVITPRLIFDIFSDIWTISRELIAKGHYCLNVRRFREDVISSFSYWIHRPLLDIALNQFEDAGMFGNGGNEFRNYYDLLPKVPSLIEIARDGVRKHIVDKLKVRSTCQYFTIVKSLELPIVYRKILLFERKIYSI